MSGYDGTHDIPDEPSPSPTGGYVVMGRSGPIGRDLTHADAVALAQVSGCTILPQDDGHPECSVCGAGLWPLYEGQKVHPDCGDEGCPVGENATLIGRLP